MIMKLVAIGVMLGCMWVIYNLGFLYGCGRALGSITLGACGNKPSEAADKLAAFDDLDVTKELKETLIGRIQHSIIFGMAESVILDSVKEEE